MASLENCGDGCHVPVGGCDEPDSVRPVASLAYHVEAAFSPGRFDSAVGFPAGKYDGRFSPGWPSWYLFDYLPYQLATFPHFVHSNIGSRVGIAILPGWNVKV